MELILVGLGGAIGSISRFQIGKMISKMDRTFPLATFIVNIMGGIGLGIFIGLNHNLNLGLLVADGFFGAFTTFSTFMYEGAYLLGQNKKVSAIIYIASSLILGILGYFLGNTLIQFLV